jgi:tetratricopeptide (TPR) repeat protein
VRIQRASTAAARAWVLANVDLSPLPARPTDAPPLYAREDATDEVLLRALSGVPALERGAPQPEPAAAPAYRDEPVDPMTLDPLADLDLSDLPSAGELDLGLEPLADLDEPDSAAPAPDFDDLSSLISFEEEAAALDSEDYVVGSATARSAPEVPLISFEHDGSADHDFAEFDDDPDSIATPRPPPERAASPAPPSGRSDNTLVADLESLVRLQDLLVEDEAPGLAHADEREGTPHSAPPRGAPMATLSAEDLGRLGFSSEDDLFDHDGADADPASDTGSRKTPRVVSDEPAMARVAVGRQGGASAYSAPTSGLPTIRDQQPSDFRPAIAAIRLDPGGGGGAIRQEPITLELGEADDWDDGPDGGFSIQVEEYEADLDSLEDAEIEPVDGPMVAQVAAPAAMPSLSNRQIEQLLQRASAAAEAGDLQQAIQLYSDALDFDPDNVPASVGRGLAWLDLSDYARAMSDFTVAEDLAPNDAEVNAAIGKLYYDRKDYGRAIDYLDQAVQQNPRHAMAWCRRGISHYYRKDYARAYNNLIEAEKLDPNIPNIRTYVGMVRKRMK